MKIKFLKKYSLVGLGSFQEGDIVKTDSQKGKYLCDCGAAEEVKAPKAKKDGKK
jgi:hypothetical protein